jgi:hypothetical protein
MEAGQQDLLSSLNLIFNRKLKTVDTAKILFADSNFNKLSGYNIQLDTSKTVLTINYPWKELNYFRVVVPKDAVTDTGGTLLSKADTLRFGTKRESEYGSLKLRFTNLNLLKHPVLQFVQDGRIVESFPLTSTELVRKLYRTGTYEMRILYDSNRNGVWDAGSFGTTKRQPEIVTLIIKPLTVRANWDNEVTIAL